MDRFRHIEIRSNDYFQNHLRIEIHIDGVIADFFDIEKTRVLRMKDDLAFAKGFLTAITEAVKQ